MEEIYKITDKYDEEYIKANLADYSTLNKFALTFFKDVADIYDAFTRVKNIQRNPSGFSLDDAPILGLLVRIWKLLKASLQY